MLNQAIGPFNSEVSTPVTFTPYTESIMIHFKHPWLSPSQGPRQRAFLVVERNTYPSDVKEIGNYIPLEDI